LSFAVGFARIGNPPLLPISARYRMDRRRRKAARCLSQPRRGRWQVRGSLRQKKASMAHTIEAIS
jgi:hypothetical protein